MCSGWRRYSRFNTAGLNDMAKCKLLIRRHDDDSVADELVPGGVTRPEAEELDKATLQFLDHDLFYTEIVELP